METFLGIICALITIDSKIPKFYQVLLPESKADIGGMVNSMGDIDQNETPTELLRESYFPVTRYLAPDVFYSGRLGALGDSGNGMLIKNKRGLTMIIAVLSSTTTEGSYFIDVFTHIKWIKKNVVNTRIVHDELR
uniref:Peptidase S1 domain-containing protein n=1 Tax=Panagrolaimus sp. PS1159 TaxID=55785 RepID=A0AC35GP63_9BILA